MGTTPDWVGYGRRDGTWTEQGEWLSYGLAHYRGRYSDSARPRLLVSHEIKSVERPPAGPQGMAYAATQAVVTFISDNHPDDLDDDGLRRWRLQRMTEQARLDSAWTEHPLRLGERTIGGRIHSMDNGYCLVADAGDAFLAVAARHFTVDLTLVRQNEVTKTYRR